MQHHGVREWEQLKMLWIQMMVEFRSEWAELLMDGSAKRGMKVFRTKSQSNPCETWFKSRRHWDIMSPGGSLSGAIRWDERLVPPSKKPHLLRYFNTWHKGPADFTISWSCPQRLFCVKRSAYNVLAGLKELREPWEKIENHADSVEAGNGWRFDWKVGVVQLIQADRVGDKNGFLSLQPSRGPTLSNLFDGERYAPLPSLVRGETGAQGRFFIEGEKLQCFLSGQPQGQLARD